MKRAAVIFSLLAAAVLALILFTVHLGTRVLLRLLSRDEGAETV